MMSVIAPIDEVGRYLVRIIVISVPVADARLSRVSAPGGLSRSSRVLLMRRCTQTKLSHNALKRVAIPGMLSKECASELQYTPEQVSSAYHPIHLFL